MSPSVHSQSRKRLGPLRGQSCWRTGFFPPQDTTANSSFCRARGASHGLEHYHTRSIMSSLGRPVSGRDLHWTKDDVGSEFSKADLWASWEEKPRLRPRAPGALSFRDGRAIEVSCSLLNMAISMPGCLETTSGRGLETSPNFQTVWAPHTGTPHPSPLRL